jgi:hypothetical protein
VGSFSFLKIQSNKWAVFIEVLWNSLASKNVVFKARSACLVRCRFFFWFEATEIFGLAGLNISTLRLRWFKSTSNAFKIFIALPSPSRKSPSIKCSVPIKS